MPVAIPVALPLLVAAADESRDELVEIWARLLVAAADPTRTKKFRLIFIEIARQMDPLDAAVLQKIPTTKPKNESERISMHRAIAQAMGLSDDEFDTSRMHLTKLELLAPPAGLSGVQFTSLGREFLRAVESDQ